MKRYSITQKIKQILPILGKVSGIGAMMLVFIASVDSVIAQSGINGLTPAIQALLTSMFGDVVAGPIIDNLLNTGSDKVKLDKLICGFQKELEHSKLREEIHQLLIHQEALTETLDLALQYNENTVIEQVLRGVATYQDFDLEKLVEYIVNNFTTQIQRLDPEVQYLLDLIADLSGSGGVSKEFTELSLLGNTNNDVSLSIVEKMRLPRVFKYLEKPQKRIRIHTDNEKQFSLIEDVVTEFPKFVLLGEAGSGKTTTLRHLAFETARKRLSDPLNAPLPLLLYLASWNKNQTIEEYILSRWRLVPDPIGLSSRGELVIFLDGLNELGPLASSRAIELREWISSDRGPKSIIITCRFDNYQPMMNLNLPPIIIEPMNQQIINKFISNYLGMDAFFFIEKLSVQDKKNNKQRQLFNLAKNPFMLIALMVVYLNSPNEALPFQLGPLFKGLTQALWEREKSKKTQNWTDFKNAEQIYAKLAFSMIQMNKSNKVPLDYVLSIIGEDNFLDLGCGASFLLKHEGEVSFFHQLIQEYFAAVEIINRKIDLNLIEHPWLFGNDGSIKRNWIEVLIMAASISEHPDKIIRDLISIDIDLAINIVTSGVECDDNLLEEIVDNISSSSANNTLPLFEYNRRTSLDRFFEAEQEETASLYEDEVFFDSLNSARTEVGKNRFLCLDYHSVPLFLIKEIGYSKGHYAAEEALIQFGKSAFDSVFLALTNEDPKIQEGALIALLSFLFFEDRLNFTVPSDLIIKTLNNLLTDADTEIRAMVIQVLALYQDECSIDPLTKLLDDTSVSDWSLERVCDDAAEVLEGIGTPKAIRVLKNWQNKN